MMNLSFFTKIFGRSVQLSSNFGKTFSYVRDACWYKDKVYQADIYRKNNTCTSCVFNGFKYNFPKIYLIRPTTKLLKPFPSTEQMSTIAKNRKSSKGISYTAGPKYFNIGVSNIIMPSTKMLKWFSSAKENGHQS